ncbi:hypothetical protein L21SP5_01158 [Salinivirga cyanobacteriivorans]|uniref:TonB C-terminal domain-containing protein n=1 Tax=Salinivirga cyanobacteriivorans TaxID=1307839 RepID=A0A0S2HXM9_9BACT|nr:M56 family metallopeptidase [Salinivirga cyanobacteriivorans]ALO14817.1 hypothetical protein L21SP5_01158 [Salinivirga cyanobacteriivorans]
MTQNWIIYLFESAVILMFFWSVYWLFLRSETFFKLNRLYLQLTLVLSLIIPVLDWFIDIKTADVTNVYLLNTIVITAQKAEVGALGVVERFQWIPVILLTGSIITLGIFGWGIFKIIALVKNSQTLRQHKYLFVLNHKFVRPFSFLNYIFLTPEIYHGLDNSHIIKHEQEHVKQKHSLDLLFSGIVGAIQWFNPFVWLYKESFREIHEYLADEAVLKQGEDPARYKKSLFDEATGVAPGVYSFFNLSFTKRRFKMMSRIKSPRSNALKLLVILPVVTLMVFVFACSEDQEKEVIIKQSKDEVKSDSVYMHVDQQPQYAGGMSALFQDVQNEIQFPDIVKQAGAQGKVFVSFVVGKDGDVRNVEVAKITDLEGNSAQFEKDVEEALIETSVNAVQKLNKWTPGKNEGKTVSVKFNIPIAFKLN